MSRFNKTFITVYRKERFENPEQDPALALKIPDPDPSILPIHYLGSVSVSTQADKIKFLGC